MPRQLLSGYRLPAARYDEMLGAPFAPREHWRPMFDALVAAPPGSMRDRQQQVERQVRENGITYNVYADPQGADRPWDLDVLPLILPQAEWDAIEAGIQQRAALLNRILADVYGPQRLLHEGMLPPALIFGHSGFLPPAHGLPAPGGVLLHFYAADLARSPDGRWWVMSDRTQAPSGAGYALENRLVISRAFPDLFRDLRVHRLAGFFAQFRDSLAHWAPREHGSGTRQPLIVLLTPGPYNETYFEHTYLARYLGFPLVEGSDLTVRDGCIWLKTLSGLQRVHVILRRLDDDFCDPLELRGDSALGIPGLTDAARRGNVLIANALGSNLLESGALLGFLPRLAEHLLGETLRMPSIATWWCGEPAALEDAVKHLDHLVIKRAFPRTRFDPVFGEQLDDRGRAALAQRMRERPHDYVAQELVRLSQAPVWDRDSTRRLLPRAIGLRVYACATPNGYVVMPGGLTRVASGPDARVISMQRGGGSKDTWVLARGPVSSLTLLRDAVGPQDLVRTGVNLSSRVVENLFWFGRYCERSDNMARLLRLSLGRLIDDTPEEQDRAWPHIVALCRKAGILDTTEPPAAPPAGTATESAKPSPPESIEVALLAAVTDEERPGLAGNLRSLFHVAFQLRDRLSLDNWRTINQLVRQLRQRAQGASGLAGAIPTLNRTIVGLMTLSGFTLDGMTRDLGWRFLSLGRRIERLQFLAGALVEAVRAPAETELDWLLELADSTITYRSRYMNRPEWLPVLDLLIRDPSNPRSLAFQLDGLHGYLRRLAEIQGPCGIDLVAPLLERVDRLDAGRDLKPGAGELATWLDDVATASGGLSDELSMRFFSHVGEVSRPTFAT